MDVVGVVEVVQGVMGDGLAFGVPGCGEVLEGKVSCRKVCGGSERCEVWRVLVGER